MHLKPIRDQVVVVMGASSGIGRATALRFASLGAKLVISARSEEGLRSLAREIEQRQAQVVSVQADTADPEQVMRVAELAVSEFGRLDTWVQVAAVTVYAPFEHTRASELKRVIDVDLLGQMYGAQAALPQLRRSGGGALIHVSSVESGISLPFSGAYAAAKHGIVGFLEALRHELRREGVNVSVTNILPSSINTPLFENALTRLGVQPRGVPPFYQPDLVADAIVYAARHPTRDLVVGGAGLLLLLAQRISPRFVDELMLTRIGFESQLTKQPKAPTDLNNLFVPTPPEHLRVYGEFGRMARHRSLATRLQMSRVARAYARTTRPFLKLLARGAEIAWALQFPRAAGLRDLLAAREGGGLPKPVQEEIERGAGERGAGERALRGGQGAGSA